MEQKEALYKYLLRLGDNGLVQGHRLAEWCSRGPILEEDLALTNMALDNIGRAQAMLKYAGEVQGNGKTEDDLAYKRGEREFYNYLMMELPIGDFAYTIAKQWFISVFEYLLYTELCKSKDATVSGIANKAIKEIRYHLAHARDWTLRLGLGTEESHRRMQNAVNELWMYTDEFFEMHEADNAMLQAGIGPDIAALKNNWLQMVSEVFAKANLQIPNVGYMQTGSYDGVHTEHLGHLLSEMQYLPRAYPDAKW